MGGGEGELDRAVALLDRRRRSTAPGRAAATPFSCTHVLPSVWVTRMIRSVLWPGSVAYTLRVSTGSTSAWTVTSASPRRRPGCGLLALVDADEHRGDGVVGAFVGFEVPGDLLSREVERRSRQLPATPRRGDRRADASARPGRSQVSPRGVAVGGRVQSEPEQDVVGSGSSGKSRRTTFPATLSSVIASVARRWTSGPRRADGNVWGLRRPRRCQLVDEKSAGVFGVAFGDGLPAQHLELVGANRRSGAGRAHPRPSRSRARALQYLCPGSPRPRSGRTSAAAPRGSRSGCRRSSRGSSSPIMTDARRTDGGLMERSAPAGEPLAEPGPAAR